MSFSGQKRKAEAGQPLDGTHVYIPRSGIRFVSTKLKAWRAGMERLGGRVTQHAQDPGITHALQEGAPGTDTKLLLQQRPGVTAVTPAWLETCLLQGRRVCEARFLPNFHEGNHSSNAEAARHGQMPEMKAEARGTRYRRTWLGPALWRAECADMTLNEFMLQGVYNTARCRGIGNEAIVQALRELAGYEGGIQDDYFTEHGELVINHRIVRYAKAATAVQGCSYKLEGRVRPGQLPFVGPATAEQISDIIRTGTCDALVKFRANLVVKDSRGTPRPDTIGGATRAAFHALPGVGQRTAKHWWDLGLRSYEDLDAAVAEGGLLSQGRKGALSVAQHFSLKHRADLLQGTSAEDVAEAVSRVLESLTRSSGVDGWTVEVVGGEARGGAAHDTDLLVTHKTRGVDHAVQGLLDDLVASGYLFSPSEAMCLVQEGLMPSHLERMRKDLELEDSAAPGVQSLDRFDHIYGVRRTAAGKVRRLDIILAPSEEFAMALVGWTGSRTYLRLLRQHAKDVGMYLNSHRLLRKIDGKARLVPDEAPPIVKGGREAWPVGWHAGRRILRQEDVFELLGVPYREPADRNCP
ncbi:hypothetical protein ACKKBG_A16945 [Auxenochlorella protothecoides x Auxenochlorella symbiontica]